MRPRRAPFAHDAPVACRHLNAMHKERARPDDAETVQIRDRAASGRVPVNAAPGEHFGDHARAASEQFRLGPQLGGVDAHRQ